ncbi:MAG: protein PhnA [Bradymonadia bacterium]|jgi:protein PhnA
MHAALQTRADGQCELCQDAADLRAVAVTPHTEADTDHGLVVCAACAAQLEGDAPDADRLRGPMQGAIWSEHAPVQVSAWRLLTRMPDEAWAAELLDQVWLDEETRAWAESGLPEPVEAVEVIVDANGTQIEAGDSVSLTRSLDVKGTTFVAKRGTVVRNIRLCDVPEHIEGKVNGVTIYIKTCYLKKVSK